MMNSIIKSDKITFKIFKNNNHFHSIQIKLTFKNELTLILSKITKSKPDSVSKPNSKTFNFYTRNLRQSINFPLISSIRKSRFASIYKTNNKHITGTPRFSTFSDNTGIISPQAQKYIRNGRRITTQSQNVICKQRIRIKIESKLFFKVAALFPSRDYVFIYLFGFVSNV